MHLIANNYFQYSFLTVHINESTEEIQNSVLNLNLYFLYNESWLLKAMNYLSITQDLSEIV